MSMFARYPWLRWIVPAGIAAAVLGGGGIARAVVALAEPSLPERSAAQLLVDLQDFKVNGLSGTVVERADLGLPTLPSVAAGSGSTDLASLLTGSHTLRVWYSGPDKARIALLGTLGETDVIVNDGDLWIWDSRKGTATHGTVPSGQHSGTGLPPISPSALPSTPQEVAKLALQAIDPTTVVSTAGTAKVAGRSAYELVLAPRDKASLVSQVRIAIDADEHVPLRTQVYAKGSDSPGFEVAFTSVSFSRPDDAQFQFNPPEGAKVEEQPPAVESAPDASSHRQDSTTAKAVVGTGWTTVLVTRLPDSLVAAVTTGAAPSGDRAGDAGEESQMLASVLSNVPKVSGSWGSGWLVRGKLFSILLVEDGRLLVGAVSGDQLMTVAADPAAALKDTE
ncbi:MAG: hypothetical protein KJO75_10325 [Dactylosporangium sp.]|nr:hypothetical protein [Dactylosporangium sp.]